MKEVLCFLYPLLSFIFTMCFLIPKLLESGNSEGSRYLYSITKRVAVFSLAGEGSKALRAVAQAINMTIGAVERCFMLLMHI